MRCQKANKVKIKVLVWAQVWEEALEEAEEEEEWEATGVVEDREVIVSARIVVRKLSISREFPVTQSTAPNAEQK